MKSCLQEKSHLEHLIQSVMKARDETTGCNASSIRHPPILLKIAPDLSQEDKKDIAEVVLQTGVEGLIVSNTTVSRPDTLKSRHAEESGGLSGHPLKEMSTAGLAPKRNSILSAACKIRKIDLPFMGKSMTSLFIGLGPLKVFMS